MTENSLAAGHIRLQVPQLKCERDLPLYHDIRELLDGCAKRFKDLPAYIIKIKKETKAAAAEYRKVSFLKLREEVDRLGAALMSIGLQGKRLAVIGKNRYEWMLGYYAQLCGLGITVPLDKDLPYDEFESSIERSKTDAVIFDPALTGYMEKLKASGHDLTFICMEEKEGYLSVPELLKKGYELPEEDIAAYRALPVDGNALSIILFTSGTTSLSKAVMLTQFNITHNCWSVSSAEDLRAGDVNMAFLPYHHTFGSTGQTMMSYVGMTTVFCDGLKYIQKNICEYGVSVFICVPLLIESIHKRIMSEIKRQGKDKTFAKGVKISRFLRKRGIDLRRRLFKDVHEKLGGKLRYIISGASPLDPVVAESFTDMGIQVVQGYGMTEASPVIAAENIPNLRFGTVGKAIPGVDVMIEDPNEEGIGEIIVRGPNVMMGYYEDEEDTEAIMGDGWLHTGDLASMDSDGFVTIRGRKKNVIVLKNGKNVYPEEIETLINNLPYVSECMVFGEPKREDDPTDLILSVRIVYNPEAAKELYEADTREAIEKLASHDIESLNAELPAYKHIYRKYITDEPMEKTTTGKVKRYKQI
jgi:long-chain acyl-CoA synthetase